MQYCDSTCSWCARQFFRWLKARAHAQGRMTGRSGSGSYSEAAATSIRPPMMCGDLLGGRSCQLPPDHGRHHAWVSHDGQITIEWIAGRVVGLAYTWPDS